MLEVPFARRVLDWSTDVSIVANDFEITGAEEEIAGSFQDIIDLFIRKWGEIQVRLVRRGGEEQTTKVDVSGNRKWSATQEHMTGRRGKHNSKSRRRGK